MIRVIITGTDRKGVQALVSRILEHDTPELSISVGVSQPEQPPRAVSVDLRTPHQKAWAKRREKAAAKGSRR